LANIFPGYDKACLADYNAVTLRGFLCYKIYLLPESS